MSDNALNSWWAGLTTQQQSEALTIPHKLPEWMTDSLKASEILDHLQFGNEVPSEFESRPLVMFLESKRTSPN